MKKGTALIYVLLISGIISAVGLSVARLSITEIRMSRLASESIAAYYAAEAGLEDGLARWRWERNVEVPSGASQDSTDVEEVDLTPSDLNDNLGYKLKIWYKADGIGNFGNIADPQNPEIKKDGVVELDVRGLNAVNLKYVPTANTNSARHGVEVIQIDEGGTQWKTDYFDQTQDSSLIRIAIAGTNVITIRIKPWDTDIKYALRPIPSDGKIDSGYTTIESTGFYRNTKRKLVATINRNSGTILNVYDFLFYGGERIGQ